MRQGAWLWVLTGFSLLAATVLSSTVRAQTINDPYDVMSLCEGRALKEIGGRLWYVSACKKDKFLAVWYFTEHEGATAIIIKLRSGQIYVERLGVWLDWADLAEREILRMSVDELRALYHEASRAHD